ncbi:MAG: DUF624 domain-containing protein [Ruminococcaceae bacterium]|nr:DUF624 domain-containing protein [Oscillospiraceae bacterium]
MKQRKPGFFDYGGQLWIFCQGLLTLIFTNIMFLLGCLPVVTIGSSLLALTEVTLDRIRYGSEAPFSVFPDFWKAYKRHLRRGVPLSIALVLVFGALVLDFLWISSGQELFPGLFGLMGAVTVILLMILSYYLPLLSTGKYSLWDGVIAAFFESFAHWGLALVEAVLVIGAVLLCLYIPNIFVSMIPVFLIIGFSLCGRILLSLIADTLPRDEDEEEYEEEEF